MDIGKGNILRSICRSLEVLLFFMISVVGFNVLVKTTSSNSKSKTNSLYGETLPCKRSLSEISHTLHYKIEILDCFFNLQHRQPTSSFTRYSEVSAFPDILHHHHFSMPHSGINQTINYLSISSLQHKPLNLLQQNPVLLI
ncbi:MAG: hypothetical protein HKK67_01210 [Chlorobiaceae bacterium]|nr:hypothetical protein [Chlorobiaceae bacterium]